MENCLNINKTSFRQRFEKKRREKIPMENKNNDCNSF